MSLPVKVTTDRCGHKQIDTDDEIVVSKRIQWNPLKAKTKATYLIS